MSWYHGGPELRTQFDDQRMERELSTSSALQEGPGIYWTTSYEEAAGYGPYVVELDPPRSLQLVPKRKPKLSELVEMYGYAEPYHQETFLADWDTDNPRKALARYTGQETLHDALVTLYGDLFHNDAMGYVEALRALGYDGVVVPRSQGVKHLITWSPDKIRGHVYEADPPREENAALRRRLLR